MRLPTNFAFYFYIINVETKNIYFITLMWRYYINLTKKPWGNIYYKRVGMFFRYMRDLIAEPSFRIEWIMKLMRNARSDTLEHLFIFINVYFMQC